MKTILEKVSQEKKEDFFKGLKESLINEEKRFIVTANPEIFIASIEDQTIANLLLDHQSEIIADGIGIVKACHKIGLSKVEKITGVDTVSFLLQQANDYHKKIMVLGCTQEVLDLFQDTLKKCYPNIEVGVLINGYVDDKEAALLKNKSIQADVIFVALGVPMQEQLIYRCLHEFNKGIIVGIGGSIDVISGSKKRAPNFFVNHGIEWLYRIGKEPKRIKRFFKNNIRFLNEIRKLK